jgi:hypothetical protein
MARDRVVATRIGTFACRSFQRDTKASKRFFATHKTDKQEKPNEKT